MMPPERKKMEYEKVQIDEWIPGVIKEVQYDPEHKTNFKDEETGENKVISAVRFMLMLDGYKHPKYTLWGTFSLHEKSNLYKKFVSSLVENPKPDMRFDLDAFNGFAIKTMWAQNGDFQNLEIIRPLKDRLKVNLAVSAPEPSLDRATPFAGIPF